MVTLDIFGSVFGTTQLSVIKFMGKTGFPMVSKLLPKSGSPNEHVTQRRKLQKKTAFPRLGTDWGRKIRNLQLFTFQMRYDMF